MENYFMENRCRTCVHDCWVPQYVMGCIDDDEKFYRVEGLYENDEEHCLRIVQSPSNTRENNYRYEPTFYMEEIIKLRKEIKELKGENDE